MMDLRGQKRIAADVLGVGVNRIKIDPEMLEDVSKAITREDIRYHISTGAISVRPERGVSRGRLREKLMQKRKGRRKGSGHRSGTKNARTGKKEAWIRKIRAIRDELRKMKENKEIDISEYRKLYRQAKGNLFHSRRHLREYVGRVYNR
jgi:large subunit ribosomal protein L19e